MPYAFILTLKPTNGVPLAAAADEYAHAAFFRLLADLDCPLATALHDESPDRKPFTLCLIRPAEAESDTGPDTAAALLRVTFLDDALFPPFAAGLLSRDAAPIQIGAADFAVTRLLTHPAAHPLAGAADYAALLAAAEPALTVAVRFATPTVFKSQKRDVLWPEPRLVWQSWARTWNQHAGPRDPKVDEDRIVDLAARCVTIESHRLSTRPVLFKSGRQTGFCGTCEYGLHALEDIDRQLLRALADFAFYSGTGRKTAMGMGQTGRLPPARRPRRANQE